MLSIGAGFALTVTNPVGAHKHLHSTAQRYSAAISGARGAGCNASAAGARALKACSVTVADTSVPLGKGVDESYALEVQAGGVCAIRAATVFGAFHGMESLAQLGPSSLFRVPVCAARALNATGQSRVTLSLAARALKSRLWAAAGKGGA